MGNQIEIAQVMQKELDDAFVAQSASGFMELNADQVIYEGGAEVKVPSIVTDGLGDYDRQEGFPVGSFSFKWQTMTMEQDRGQMFEFDEHSVDETAFLLQAPKLMGQFQRQHVIPEVDAYRFSKIATGAIGKSYATSGYTPAEGTLYQKLKYDIAAVQERVGTDVQLVIAMNITTAAMMAMSDKFKHVITQQDFQKGDVTTKVKSLDGQHPVLEVPAERLFTAYEFFDGRTAGQEKGGFKKADSAKTINWLIMARNAPLAVCKTDKIRIFDPETYQKKRAWAADYRKFHDLWITDNKWTGIHVNTKEA